MRKAVLALGLVFAAGGLCAQQPAFHSAGPREDLSVLAGHMLQATNQARIAIKNGNINGALKHVKQAESYLKQVEAGAHGRTMIPVYQEFVSVSILSPVQAAQRKLTNTNAAVHQVAGDYTSVVVNTTVAKNNLSAAQAALERGDLKTADSALQDVQEGVEISMSNADMPLTKVRENLILARSYARKNDWEGAQNALTAASHALKNYENQNGPHAQAAMDLQRQIDEAASNVQQNHANILAEINKWWNETADWTPYKLKPSAG